MKLLPYVYGLILCIALLGGYQAQQAASDAPIDTMPLRIDPNYLAFMLAMVTSGLALAVELYRSRPVGIGDHNDHELRLGALERHDGLTERVAVLEHTTVTLQNIYELDAKIMRIATRVADALEEMGGGDDESEEKDG